MPLSVSLAVINALSPREPRSRGITLDDVQRGSFRRL